MSTPIKRIAPLQSLASIAAWMVIGLFFSGCARPNTARTTRSTPTKITASSLKSRRQAAPLAAQYLTFSNGEMVPCDYNQVGGIRAVAVAGIWKGAIRGQQRTPIDRAEESYIRAKIARGEFLPGIYHGGPVTYSTGNGLVVFTP